MTEKDKELLAKMQALMDAADAQANNHPGAPVGYRYQCFAMIEVHFWALADQLSFKRNYDRGGGRETTMTAFLLAHDPVTSKWYTDTLEQLGLEDRPHG